jgi:hypothetical protein
VDLKLFCKRYKRFRKQKKEKVKTKKQEEGSPTGPTLGPSRAVAAQPSQLSPQPPYPFILFLFLSR